MVRTFPFGKRGKTNLLRLKIRSEKKRDGTNVENATYSTSSGVARKT